jgi:hypothetical protein
MIFWRHLYFPLTLAHRIDQSTKALSVSGMGVLRCLDIVQLIGYLLAPLLGAQAMTAACLERLQPLGPRIRHQYLLSTRQI